MPHYDKLSLVISLILLCLALSLVVVLPTCTFSFVALGFPLTIQLSPTWLVALLLAGVAGSGTAYLIHLHPLSRDQKPTFIPCILPSLATLLAALLLPRAPNPIYALGGLGVMGFLLPLIILAELRLMDPVAPGYRIVRLGLNCIAYLIALIFFALIYEDKASPLVTVASALAGSSLLALKVLHGAQQNLRLISLYALIVGLVMGEIVWVLSYLPVHTLTAGVLLLLIFYLITELAQQGLLESFSRRLLIEFAVVALIGLAILLKYAP